MTEPPSTAPFGPPPAGPLAPPPRRRRRWLVIGAIVAMLAVAGVSATLLVLDHRAEQEAAERRAAAAREEERRAEEAERAEIERQEQELAAQQEEHDTCVEQVQPLMDAVSEVDALLDVGLSYADYTGHIGDVSVAYNGIDVDQLGTGACLKAAAELESAFNAYNRVAQRWGECLGDYACDTDSIDPMMQRNWRSASRDLDAAQELVAGLEPVTEGA